MGSIFNLDSPIMRALSKMTDLLILNLLTLVCCIPIITAGASLTACHYMALKMARREESYVVRGFFKSFKQNFKQATIIWLMLLVAVVVLAGDFLILNSLNLAYGTALKVVITVVAIIVLFTATFIFPTLAKFDNPVMRTIKNAFVISVLQFPKTILMIILNIIPILLTLIIQVAPLSFLFGFSVPAFVSAYLYSKFFKKLEAQIIEKNGGEQGENTAEASDERIFYDEPEETDATENRKK